MSERKTTTNKQADLNIYAEGLLSCSVCAPAHLSGHEVAEILEEKQPSGSKMGWHLSRNTHFRAGQINGFLTQCDGAARRHWLFDC